MLDVFISHSTKDNSIVTAIHQKLTSVGIETWVDHLQLRPGDDWDRAITKALKEAKSGLFVLSASSAESLECINEYRTILELGKPLYVALIEDIPAEDYPYRLRTIQRVDLMTNFDLGMEQLIAAIQHGSTKENAVAKDETQPSSSNITKIDDEFIKHIIETGEFTGIDQLIVLLEKLNGWYVPDPDGSAFRDVLREEFGILTRQFDAAFEFGLAIYEEEDAQPTPEEYRFHGVNFSTFGGIELTDLGKAILDKYQK